MGKSKELSRTVYRGYFQRNGNLLTNSRVFSTATLMVLAGTPAATAVSDHDRIWMSNPEDPDLIRNR